MLSVGKPQSLKDFFKYFPKNMALLVQKLLIKKCQNPYPTILRRKKKEEKKAEMVGVKALVALPIKTRKKTFLRLPLP